VWRVGALERGRLVLMKPEQLRAARKAQEILDATENVARRQMIEAVIHNGAGEHPIPELIPHPEDLDAARRDLRGACRQAGRAPHGVARDRKVDAKVIPAMARVIYLERVMGLDVLQRAALTPRQLRDFMDITRKDLQDKLTELRFGVGSEPVESDSEGS
jgi:hypothetical protein